MLSLDQNPKQLLAQGNLESALETLVRLTEHADNAELRQRVLALSGQFAALKKQQLTGLLEDKDYRLQLNRITAAVAEIVDSQSQDSHSLTRSETTASTRSQPWKKWAGILASIAGITGYTLRDFLRPKPVPVEKPVLDIPKKDTIVVTAPPEKPKPEVQKKSNPAPAQKSVDVKVEGDIKNSNIIIGDGNQIKQ
ncbi:MAG: hypothetical protein ACKVT2_16880 [Saprospiraceae bacterium]